MRVDVQNDGAMLKSVVLKSDQGFEVTPVCRFLQHILDAGNSPNTAKAYAYDLKLLFEFLDEMRIEWREFFPAESLDFLSWLRRRPSRRSAQRLGLAVATSSGRRLAPATVARVLAAVSSFYEWAILVGALEGENPMRRRRDHALARVPARHQPFTGGASRQQPIRREVRIKLPLRLPRPLSDEHVAALLEAKTSLRDRSMLLLMLDAGLRPGEVLSLHLEDIAYGKRRIMVCKRDDHPRGARGKSRSERVVDVLDPRTLDSVSAYVMHERPQQARTPFVFLVGGKGTSAVEPLSYAALVKMFARRMERLGIRTAEKTPHALRHTHATLMWEGGMRELALQKRLGHASPESTRIYTKVSDDQVRAEYESALGRR